MHPRDNEICKDEGHNEEECDEYEDALIRRARQGDEVAFGELYERHVTVVYRFMFYRTGDEMVAEDLTSQVFVNVLTGIQRYEIRGLPFRAWLFRIARARLADYYRHTERRDQGRTSLIELREAVHPRGEDPDDQFRYESLRQALDYLTPAELDAVLLRFVGDLTNREVSLIIDSNANAVKSKIRRALKKMRQVIERIEAFNES
jgi:RNA polymerase sigma-70 factor (ECF subfamily)